MGETGGTMRCGSFVATCIGYNRWKLTCDWLPDWAEEIDATQARASDCIIRLQAENRRVEVVR
jgi:hypothetical protein